MVNRVNRMLAGRESAVMVALQALILMLVAASTVTLIVLAFDTLRIRTPHLSDVGELLTLVQRSVAVVLTVVAGLEIIETLKTYFREHHIRLEVILVVAITAVAHLDLEHSSPLVLFGLSAVVLALTIGFFLTAKRSSRKINDSYGRPVAYVKDATCGP